MEPSRLLGDYLAALDLQADAPTRELLDAIVRRHVATFPFASAGPRLGDALPLDAGELFERIVVRRRGGYCFEQNGLLFAVLTELGYQPRLQLARVIHNGDHLPGLTHRISLVSLDGIDHVVDVGFGPSGPATPIPVPTPNPVPTTVPVPTTEHGVGNEWSAFRVFAIGPGQYHLQCRKDGAPYSLYRFDTGVFSQSDCELGHFYSHRHPEAVFVNNLVVSRIFEDEIWSLRNRGFMVLAPDGTPRSTSSVHDAGTLAALLRERFRIVVTDDEVLRLFESLPPG